MERRRVPEATSVCDPALFWPDPEWTAADGTQGDAIAAPSATERHKQKRHDWFSVFDGFCHFLFSLAQSPILPSVASHRHRPAAAASAPSAASSSPSVSSSSSTRPCRAKPPRHAALCPQYHALSPAMRSAASTMPCHIAANNAQKKCLAIGGGHMRCAPSRLVFSRATNGRRCGAHLRPTCHAVPCHAMPCHARRIGRLSVRCTVARRRGADGDRSERTPTAHLPPPTAHPPTAVAEFQLLGTGRGSCCCSAAVNAAAIAETGSGRKKGGPVICGNLFRLDIWNVVCGAVRGDARC